MRDLAAGWPGLCWSLSASFSPLAAGTVTRAIWTARSGGDEIFGELAAGVEIPVEACDLVGFLERGAFWGAWRARDPYADRDMADIDAPSGQYTVEGECPFA